MAERMIEIPAVHLRQMIVTIQGQTPLICHRFGERAMEEIEGKQQRRARGAREARDPEAEFKDALYPLGEGTYGFPAAGIKKALVVAGGRFTDEKMTILRGVVNILADMLEIKGSKPEMRRDTVRIGAGKTTSIAYRPMFRHWEMDVPIVYNAALIGEAQILNLFQIAGFAVGIGDWRPERGGDFGQFAIKEARAI